MKRSAYEVFNPGEYIAIIWVTLMFDLPYTELERDSSFQILYAIYASSPKVLVVQKLLNVIPSDRMFFRPQHLDTYRSQVRRQILARYMEFL